MSWIDFVGPNNSLELFGIKLVGINAETAAKALISLIFIVVVYSLSRFLRYLANRVLRGYRDTRVAFWSRQGINVTHALVLVVGLISIWFDEPTRLATALGLVTAGLAFALQRVVTAFAGYIVILRGETFNVGDRITMGGVRGDVVKLGFLQTTILEMGQPPSVQNANPAMWVRARQYSGRTVTVSNAKVFDEPIFNYTRDFPYLWEEMVLPIPFKADRVRAERILLEAASLHSVDVSVLAEPALRELERRYVTRAASLQPRVYWRITDNWLELTVRFIAMDHGVRDVKDAMARHILPALDDAGISIASTTIELSGLPEVRLRMEGPSRRERRVRPDAPPPTGADDSSRPTKHRAPHSREGDS